LVTGITRENCYICLSDQELALIDPGEEPGLVKQALKEYEQKPVKLILTHYHADHAACVPELKQFLGEVPVLCHKADAEYLDFPVDELLEDRSRVRLDGQEMKVLHTPGHSKGSICLLGEDFIFTGDTVFRDGYGRTDFPGGSDEALNRSLRQLQAVFRPGLTVYPGHGEAFRI